MLAGCDQTALKEESTGAEETPTPTEAEKRVNAALDAMAKDVAAALENRSVRTLIKKETGTLLAGEHNVLYETIASKKIGGQGKASSRTFEEVLAGQRASLAKGGKALSRSEAVKQVRKDAAAIPKFDIGVPVHHKQWNAKEMTPLVAFHHRQEIDDTNLERIKAYDAEGNVHWLDAQEAPERPVVVVGINERTTADGKVHPAFKGNEKACAIRSYAKCGGGGGYGGGGGSYESPREYGDQEQLEEIYLHNELDNWFHGGPEVRLRIRSLNDPGSDEDRGIEYNLNEWSSGLGDDEEEEWKDVSEKMFKWTKDVGEKTLWFFFEHDNGDDGSKEIDIQGTDYVFDRGYTSDCDDFGWDIVSFDVDDDKYDYQKNEVKFRVESVDPQ